MDGDVPMWDTGISISFNNGVGLVSYYDEPVALREKSGDEVQICLISVPKNCPKGDVRGKVYGVYDTKQRRAYQMADSQHECGGA